MRWSPWGKRGNDLLGLIDQPHLCQNVIGAFQKFDMAFRDRKQIETLSRPGLRDKTHVFAHAQGGKQVRQLERAANAAVRPIGDGEPRDVFAVQRHGAACRPQLPGNKIEIGRLASPVRPHDGRQCPPLEPAGDTINGNVTAETDRQVAGFKNGIFWRHRNASCDFEDICR